MPAMTRSSDNDKKPRKSGARAARLAAALRENLRRRKAQERGRGAEPAPDARSGPAQAPHDDKNG
ncbi:MAG TPA: hypothetical protein VIJ17_10695 [Pseudolabrys sp.]